MVRNSLCASPYYALKFLYSEKKAKVRAKARLFIYLNFQTHSGPLQCDICKIHFKDQRKLYKHMNITHLFKYSCQLCSYVCCNRYVFFTLSSTLYLPHQPKDVHCWTLASPKCQHSDRIRAFRFQGVPATFRRLSVHLVGPNHVASPGTWSLL